VSELSKKKYSKKLIDSGMIRFIDKKIMIKNSGQIDYLWCDDSHHQSEEFIAIERMRMNGKYEVITSVSYVGDTGFNIINAIQQEHGVFKIYGNTITAAFNIDIDDITVGDGGDFDDDADY
jgi:hypothetical protein